MTVTADVDALNRELDADPTNQDVRRALADAFADAGDERAEGYAALAACGLSPNDKPLSTSQVAAWFDASKWQRKDISIAMLPTDWFALIARTPSSDCRFFDYRNDAEDAAARAFALLPETRRAELLAGKM